MQTIESLVSALIESLQNSGLSLLERMSGEYWITDTDEILDASPAKHADVAMRVLAPMGSKLREILRTQADPRFDSLPPEELKKYGEFIEYTKKNGFKRSTTPINFAVEEMNWIHVFGNTFRVQNLTDENVKRIVSFLLNKYEIKPEGEDADEELIVHAGKEMLSVKLGEFLGDQTNEPSASSLRKYTYGMTEVEFSKCKG